jgi:dimethylargininase
MSSAPSNDLVALTRAVSPRLAECELTHLDRRPIDLARARAQHAAYRAALARLGCDVVLLPELPDAPDGVFVEDVAVVLDEVAILTRPGAASRRGEVASVEAALAEFRELERMAAPATLDGGDVMVVDRRVFVGATPRSNAAGHEGLRRIVGGHGYALDVVEVQGCLHLLSGATHAGRGAVVVDPRHVSPDAFTRRGLDVVLVDPGERAAANVLPIDGAVLCSASSPRTAERLAERGFEVEPVANDELAKAEGALTCCSIVFRRRPA